MIIRPARAEEHAELVKLAKSSGYTKHFSNRMMFSGDDAYERGWIRVASVDPGGGDYIREQIVGLTCVRHKVRSPETVLYFVVVDPSYRGQGVARALVEDLHDQAKRAGSERVALNVAKDNDRAVHLYEQFGYRFVGESLSGAGWKMEKQL